MPASSRVMQLGPRKQDAISRGRLWCFIHGALTGPYPGSFLAGASSLALIWHLWAYTTDSFDLVSIYFQLIV